MPCPLSEVFACCAQVPTLDEHIWQRQQPRQPARQSCRFQLLQRYPGVPLMVRKIVCSNIHALRAALSRPSLANPLLLDVRSNSVRRVRSEWWCAHVHQIGRCGSSSTSRRCEITSASSTSSAVRCCGRAPWPLRCATERVLLARVAGPFSRCSSPLAIIPPAEDISGSGFTLLSADMWPSKAKVRSEGSRRVRFAHWLYLENV